MTIETSTVDAPAYWAPYLINGDASGFDIAPQTQAEAELHAASDFEDELHAEGWRVVSCSDLSHFGAFRGTLCDLLTYDILREAKP